MSRLRVALVVLALLGPGFATAMFSVEEGGLKVLYPPGNKQRMDMALADFGEPKYGGTLTGKLVYPTSDQLYDGYTKLKCWPSDCQYACSAFNSSVPVYQITKAPGQMYIMLVDRGPRTDKDNNPCDFVEKVYNAQMAGADAVLVGDDEDGDLSTAVAPEDEQYLRELKDLKISAAMITKANADLLRQVLRDSKGQVTVRLNWTNILPRKQVVRTPAAPWRLEMGDEAAGPGPQVTWELWTNSNDECGTLCDVQRRFVTAMRSTAQDLARNHQSSFTPHYLIWSCPLEFLDTTECQTECIMNGTYCVPDPDNDMRTGYKGSEVLMMNIRQLCFFKVANASGKPWLWWDYVDTLGANCSMAAHKYTEACATQVFTAVRGSDLLDGQGLVEWQKCTNFDKVNGDVPKPAEGTTNVPWFPQSSLLEAELKAQNGTDGESSVFILPTIRINNKLYRGDLDAPGVTRALCSAFPSGQEPPVCNQQWLSDNECEVGSDGYKLCQVAGDSTNRCINTFSGYRCVCGVGWMRAADPDSGSELCEDIDECLATNVISTNPQCSCERCACINTVGSYKCIGPRLGIADMKTELH